MSTEFDVLHQFSAIRRSLGVSSRKKLGPISIMKATALVLGDGTTGSLGSDTEYAPMSSWLNSSHSLLIRLRTRRSNNRAARWRAELGASSVNRGFRLGERPLPTSHELAVEPGVFPVEGAHTTRAG